MNETPTNSANEELLKPSASFLGIYNLWIHQVTWNLVRRMLFFIVLSIQQSGYFWNGQANMQHFPNFIRVQLFQKMIWPCRIKKFLQNLLVHLFLISTLLQTLPSMFLIVGAGTGNTNPNLRPRHHLDNWSEYFPNIIWIKKKQIKNTNIYIHFKFHSKQRIDSGFFLFKAEQKKIEIISKNCKNWWNRWTMILFRQLCYFFAFILRVWTILFHMVSVMSYTHIVRNKLCQASYTNRTGRMQFFTKISGNLLSIDHEKQTK